MRNPEKCVVCGGPAILIDIVDAEGNLVSFCERHIIYGHKDHRDD